MQTTDLRKLPPVVRKYLEYTGAAGRGPWTTPVKNYRDFGRIRLASFASAIYRKPEVDFCYGEFEIRDVEYNCRTIR
jgi:hypothetical protein